MKVLVIGGGGKEHALIWKLSQSKHIAQIYCAPGNAGIAGIAECIDVSPHHVNALVDFVKYEWIDLTIVCSETMLAKSIVDVFERSGCKVFGLSGGALTLGGSRVSSKNFMKRHRIPTAEFQVFSSHLLAQDYVQLKGLPLVIKTDGYPGDEGVFLASTFDDAADTLRRIMRGKIFGDSGNRVIIEEHLKGERISLITIVDGGTILPLASTYKCRVTSDSPAHSAGTVCGSYTPVASITKKTERIIMDQVMHPVHAAFSSERISFRGFISADLIIQEDYAYLAELRFGFGDLEPQVIMPTFGADIGEAILLASEGRLSDFQGTGDGKAAVSIGLFTKSQHPEGSVGFPIRGLDALKGMEDVYVFHENTLFENHDIVTPGGAALSVTATGSDIHEATVKVYRAAEKIQFDGKQYTMDMVRN